MLIIYIIINNNVWHFTAIYFELFGLIPQSEIGTLSIDMDSSLCTPYRKEKLFPRWACSVNSQYRLLTLLNLWQSSIEEWVLIGTLHAHVPSNIWQYIVLASIAVLAILAQSFMQLRWHGCQPEPTWVSHTPQMPTPKVIFIEHLFYLCKES